MPETHGPAEALPSRKRPRVVLDCHFSPCSAKIKLNRPIRSVAPGACNLRLKRLRSKGKGIPRSECEGGCRRRLLYGNAGWIRRRDAGREYFVNLGVPGAGTADRDAREYVFPPSANQT